MSHKLSHTIFRSGTYYYNRRVPDRVIVLKNSVLGPER